ncbi:hypothetical protein L9F63_018730, partial [Diploptera punctata]
CRTLKTSIMFSVYTEKRNLIESTKEFNWKNRRIGIILHVADQTKITEVVLSLRILGNSLPILRKRRLSCMTDNINNVALKSQNIYTQRKSSLLIKYLRKFL